MPNTSAVKSESRNNESCGIIGTIVACGAAKCLNVFRSGPLRKIYLSNFIEVYSNQKMSGRLISYGCIATYKSGICIQNAKSERDQAGSVNVPRSAIASFSRIYLLNASAGAQHRDHAKDAPKVSRPHDALYENPALRGYPSHRITHPRPTMAACGSTGAPPFRSEIAVAHRQSIRRAFEKSMGDGSFGKSLSAS